MSINLQKGQKVDLTKNNPGLTKIVIGLGWDTNKYRGKANFDLDASAFLLDSAGKFIHEVSYRGLRSPCGSVKHSGDNLTGAGEGDDEQIAVELNKVPENIHRIVFVVNIFKCIGRRQDFGMVENAFIRVVNASNNAELCRFNLTEDYSGKTALIAAEVYRHKGEWKFAALGESSRDPGLDELIERYR